MNLLRFVRLISFRRELRKRLGALQAPFISVATEQNPVTQKSATVSFGSGRGPTGLSSLTCRRRQMPQELMRHSSKQQCTPDANTN